MIRDVPMRDRKQRVGISDREAFLPEALFQKV